MWAAEKGHADFVRLLLDAGADTNATTDVRASAGGGVGWRWRTSAVFDFALGHLCRVVTVLAGCYARKRAICTSVFSLC